MSPHRRFLAARSISQRFALAIGAGAGLILIVLALANYYSGRELLLEQTSSEALKEVHHEMRAMDDLVKRIAVIPYVIGATHLSREKQGGVTVPWLASLLEYCPIKAVYGLYMAIDGKDWRDPASDIWVDRKSWPKAAHLKYDFHDPSQDWYHGAKGKPFHVTQPYFDEGGSDIDMISITQPVYDRAGSFIGVAGVDVALDEMRRIVRKMHIRDFGASLAGESGRVGSLSQQPKQESNSLRESAYLLSSTGAIIVSPEEAGGTTKGSSANDPSAALDELLNQGLVTSLPGIKEVLASPSGWLRLKDGSDKVIYWAEGKNTGWKLVLEVPYQLIVGPARTLAIQSAVIGGAGLLLLLGVVFVTARRISAPINELQAVASNFEKGSYDESSEVLDRIGKRADELGRFASSFSAMANEIRLREERLSEWNANLEKTVAERTAQLAAAMSRVEKANRAMASEISEAAAYARAVLPGKLNGPVKTDWVFVTSSQLGGDSFGYHWIDDNHLALYLLDVCGHGVGAALLSVSVVNVLRTASLAGTDFHDPAAVLANLNAAFPMEQHNDMYFTAWYGVYDKTARELRFACGGHPPAALLKPDGEILPLSAKGPVLGAFPRGTYETVSVTVPSGSHLYLFSDGAYEIDRPDAPMMTHEEFLEILKSHPSENRLHAVVSEIRRQQGQDSFSDDFSLMEFDFSSEDETTDNDPPSALPNPLMSTHEESLTIANNLEEVIRLTRFAGDFAQRRGMSGNDAVDLEVIVEEIATNVMKYGGIPPRAEACTLLLRLSGDTLEIRFSDRGGAFDPLQLPEVDTAKPIEDRPIGGLGIHFIKKLTDTQHYEYKDGENILTLTKELRS